MMTISVAKMPIKKPLSLCLEPGQTIPQLSNPQLSKHLWHIEQGLVRTLTRNDKGDVVTLGLWGEGDCIGAHLSNATSFQMECLSPVQVQAHPFSEQELTEAIQTHLCLMQELFCIISNKQASQRLLRFLDWLGDRFGRQGKRGRILDVGLTHQLIAEIIGIARVTTTRLFNEFEREGKISRLSKQQILLQYNFS